MAANFLAPPTQLPFNAQRIKIHLFPYLYLMIPFPLQPPVENLPLLARQVVEGFLIGLHKSPFHGFSVEFAEHRLYNPGDNLRYVDWKVYGRSDKMFLKKFQEETNLRCCLAIDTSSSMNYPASGMTKLDYACVSAASLGWLIKKQMDALSLALFDTELYYLCPPKTGGKQQQFIISELENLLRQPKTKRLTNLPESLHQLAERLHQRSLVIIFSDIPESPSEGNKLLAALQHLKFNKHEVIFIHIAYGEKEIEFNFENRPYLLEDPETGESFQLNPENYRSEYQQEITKYHNFLKNEMMRHETDLLFCDMNKAPEDALRAYLVKRNKMM